jgi:hypothetical protein
MPVPVDARSKVKVGGQSPSAIPGPNPTGGMDVVCAVGCLRPADHSSRKVLTSVVCVIYTPREWRGAGPLGAVIPKTRNTVHTSQYILQ